MSGGPGEDIADGGAGADQMHGKGGQDRGEYDTLDYSDRTQPVWVELECDGG